MKPDDLPATRLDRMSTLTQRLHDRLYHRAERDLKHYRTLTLETVEHLKKTLDIVSNIAFLKNCLRDYFYLYAFCLSWHV